MKQAREAARAVDPVEQNLLLARRVAEAAQQEMLEKARRRVPALGLGVVAGAFGMLATAATYRMNVLLLERRLPPEVAALVAATVYGGGAGAAALAASRKWRGQPAPVPSETAGQVAEILTGTELPTQRDRSD
ncbi:phage holin family protein [Actinomadura syzygii]|uniref:Phage holin family protein n=1 Tax=Actinomadura syzygii TaxID=1427538 RepID=A0A5D0UID7_9ACTN|nr:phage holin family protein [Actinomadura syzygii]TYC17365.1 hypothetical protein FXF65_04950 [Actinomadura syzygii]